MVDQIKFEVFDYDNRDDVYFVNCIQNEYCQNSVVFKNKIDDLKQLVYKDNYVDENKIYWEKIHEDFENILIATLDGYLSEPRGLLSSIHVDEDFRRAGIGKTLYQNFSHILKSNNILALFGNLPRGKNIDIKQLSNTVEFYKNLGADVSRSHFFGSSKFYKLGLTPNPKHTKDLNGINKITTFVI